MTTTIDYQQHTVALLRGLVASAAAANELYAEPFAAATVIDGEEIPAETEADRHATVYDRIQADLVYLLLATAPDLPQLLDYINYCASQARHFRAESMLQLPPPQPAMPARAATAADGDSDGAVRDDARIVWSIHPDVYFAAMAAKETL